MGYHLLLITKNFGMKINRLLGVVVLGLLLSVNGYTESVDFAINISEPSSISSILGSHLTIEILDLGSISSILGDAETWKVVGTCSNVPNLTVEILDPGSISSILGDAKQIKIVDNSIFSADKKICITNANDLDAETLKLLKLID